MYECTNMIQIRAAKISGVRCFSSIKAGALGAVGQCYIELNMVRNLCLLYIERDMSIYEYVHIHVYIYIFKVGVLGTVGQCYIDL